MPCGSWKPRIVLISFRFATSITPTLSLPSSATDNHCRLRSIARWSIRPLTGPSGILVSSCSGTAAVCAFAMTGLSSRNASSRRRMPRSAFRDIDMVQRGFQPGCELLRIVMRPEMHEEEAWLLTDHVVVHGCNLYTVLAQCLHHRRDFLVGQNEIAGNRRFAAAERLKINGVRQTHARRYHHVLFLDWLS